jgi:hypothetical protein
MKDKLTFNEIAELMSREKCSITRRAKKEGWSLTLTFPIVCDI